MDLQSLAASLKEMFSPGSSAIYTAPGQSYGPAVSRLTRTPIKFTTSLGRDINGVYNEDLALLPGKPPTTSISINPKSDEIQAGMPISDIIRHEDIHALLDKTLSKASGPNADTYQALSMMQDENKYHPSIQAALQGHRGGYLPVEVPAYAGQHNYKQYGIDPISRAGYVEDMIKNLKSIDPKASDIYRYMSGVR